jgi:quinoprotein glucose dehydrogenase
MYARSILLLAAIVGLSGPVRAAGAGEWAFTEGALGGGRYSPLAEIDATNVHRLEVAWTYRHGDVSDGSWFHGRRNATAMEATPIVVDGRMIFSTPFDRVIALDPETGRELWTFDPRVDRSRVYVNLMISRGVAYWRSADRPAECVAAGIPRDAVDAAVGARCSDGPACAGFGDAGRVDLLDGLDPVVDPAEANMTSPPGVIGDVVVVGSAFADEVRRRAPPGERARLRRAQRKADLDVSHHSGGRRAGSGDLAREPARGLGCGERLDHDDGGSRALISSSCPSAARAPISTAAIASETISTRARWSRARVDRRARLALPDPAPRCLGLRPPAPPCSSRSAATAALVDAVAQMTKTGLVFVLDRDTGVPVFPVEERPVPASDVPGEVTSATQPFPSRPPPLLRLELGSEDLWDSDRKHLHRCREWLARLRNEGVFTPPSLGGTLMHPYTGGGANWSGAAYDPVARRMFIPVGNEAGAVALSKVPGDARETGRRPYSMCLARSGGICAEPAPACDIA